MSEQWRPENWNEIAIKAIYGEGRIVSNEAEEFFEAGADAMLKALGGKGDPRVLTYRGTWVFIPDTEPDSPVGYVDK